MGLPQDPSIDGDRRGRGARAQLLDRIRAEFKEMPCLRLTCRQAQRLFGIRDDICERVLATLIGEGLLTCGPDARYGLRADLTWRTFPPLRQNTSVQRHS